jgi:hypothetical protein
MFSTLISSIKILFFLIIIVSFVNFLIPINVVHANNAYGGSGWFLAEAVYAGDGTPHCGTNATAGQMVLREHDSNTPINPAEISFSWTVRIYDEATGALLNHITVAPGNNVSPIYCYQFDDNIIKVITPDSTQFYNHIQSMFSGNSNSPAYYRKFYQGSINLLRKTNLAQNLEPMYPVAMWINSDPSYQLNTNLLPPHSLYNTSSINYTRFNLWSYNTSSVINTTNFFTSGGVGTRTFSALGLSDGVYEWASAQALDGNITLADGLTFSTPYPFSGWTKWSWFVLDTTPPSTIASIVQSGTNVTLTNKVQDTLSGLVSTTLYVEETSPGSSVASNVIPISGWPTTEQTITVPITVAAGSSYKYYAVTKDYVGNSNTSNSVTFSTPAPNPTATISGHSCTIPTGGSSCNGDLTWTISNATSPNVYNETASTQISTNSSGSGVSVLLQKGANKFLARNNVTSLEDVSLLADCGSSDYWNGTSCFETPTLKVIPGATLIRSGKTTPVTLGVTSSVNLNCTVYGLGAPISFPHLANASETEYHYTTQPLYSEKVIQLTCTAVGVSVTKEASVKVTGTIQEI